MAELDLCRQEEPDSHLRTHLGRTPRHIAVPRTHPSHQNLQEKDRFLKQIPCLIFGDSVMVAVGPCKLAVPVDMESSLG